MITNERQYKIANSQLNKIEEFIDSFKSKNVNTEIRANILIKAELDALLSERENLMNQILKYEALKSGKLDKFEAQNLEELPRILIEARIAKNLSQRKLAEIIGVKEQQIQRYEAEHYATANLTRLAQIANALNLNINEIAEFKVEEESVDINNEKTDWNKFPFKEMYKRNWFNDFYSGSLPNAIKNAEQLTKYFFENTYCKPSFSAAHQRIRSGAIVNKYALTAWQCRIFDLARKEKIRKKFSKKSLDDDWFNNLIKLSLQSEGPKKAMDYLYESGIHLIIQPRLPQTHLDGAVFLLNDEAIIGMTLRYDRIDNFWFVLFHELIHLKNHLNKGIIESIFDDLETDAEDIEKNADEEAEEMLIPKKIWETALPRYIQTQEAINDFAINLNVSPAIVAGKIRREMKNYIILNDMVGQGEVRKQFPEIDFSY